MSTTCYSEHVRRGIDVGHWQVVAHEEEMVGRDEVARDGGGWRLGTAILFFHEENRCKYARRKAPVRSGVDDGELRRARGLIGEQVDDKGGVGLAVLRRHVADAVQLKNAQNLQIVIIMLCMLQCCAAAPAPDGAQRTCSSTGQCCRRLQRRVTNGAG